MHDLAARIAADLEVAPFPHAVLHEVFPREQYLRLRDSFPAAGEVVKSSIRHTGRPLAPNTNYQYHWAWTRGVPLESPWFSFMSEYTHPDWWKALDETICLRGYHPQVEGKSVGLRYRDSWAKVQLDAFWSVNTPVEVEGSVKGPHLDNPREVFALLIYFPEEGDDAGGDLGIYEALPGAVFTGKQMCDKVKLVKTVPYEENTGIFFVNTPQSLHGVLPRKPTDRYRRYVNLEAEFHRPLFRVPT